MAEGFLKSRAAFVAAFLLMAVGSFFLLAPVAANGLFQMQMQQELQKLSQDQEVFQAYAHQENVASDWSGDTVVSGETAGRVQEIVNVYRQLKVYNARVSGAGAYESSDPFAAAFPAANAGGAARQDASGSELLPSTSFPSAVNQVLPDEIAVSDLENGLLGAIEIPAMNCALPLYFGSSPEHLSKGAAVVEGSSAPLGEVPSNCLIAGHRGWNDLAMFRDIERLSPGDAVMLHMPWGDLAYTVAGIDIVSPQSVDVAAIREGGDMLTLITCHPYGYNYQRYVVYCVREGSIVTAADEDADEVFAGSREKPNEEPRNGIDEILGNPAFEDVLRASGVAALMVCFVAVARRMRGTEARK